MIPLTLDQQESLHCLTFNLLGVVAEYPDTQDAIAAVFAFLYTDLLSATPEEAVAFAEAARREFTLLMETANANLSSRH